MTTALGLGWAVVAAAALLALARRYGDPLEATGRRLARSRGLRVVFGVRARAEQRRRDGRIAHELPVLVDLVGMAVAAGCPPALAVDLTVPWSPPEVRAAFTPVVERTVAFADALGSVGRDDRQFRRLGDALLVSERTGAPIGVALTRVADQLRAETRRRAETRARTVPVHLLFPLVFLILPAFVLLTVVPAIAIAFTP